MQEEIQMKRELITAIVTGGASGIGESVVREIITHGGRVGIIDLNIEKGNSLAKELGANCIFEPANVTDESGFSNAYRLLKNKLPSITACVTCAGVLPVRDPISEHSFADFRHIMDNHLAGTFLSCIIVGSDMA